MLKLFYIIIGSIFSGMFYYLGGQGGTWYKSSWIRDYVCSLIVLAVLQWLGYWHWSLWLCYPLMVGASSTYWKKKGTDAVWYNWALHGLGWGLALLPYGIAVHQVQAIICRGFLLGGLMAYWSSLIVVENKLDVKWDAGGRGALIIATLLLF